ncbi:hypothetical protein [Salmonirosea aquatica]|uniref:Uncharacterized protein n=1 Tax=Salmonirosea aquatica TaxID=2654236 RepID=A0A7C9B9B2_9BACT|nr:hypothetical protein [Cytophagaceae bacterium SJW1-29]
MNTICKVLILGSSLWSTCCSAGIEQYYEFTNRAELFIIQKSHIKALQLYDSAFSSVDKNKIFVGDLYNGSVCAAKLSEWNTLKTYCLWMAENGCPITFFKKSIFKGIISESRFYKKLETTCQVNSQKRNITLNDEYGLLVEKYDSLMKYCSATGDFDNPYRLTLSKQVGLFIGRYGYPTDNDVGTTVRSDTILRFSKFSQIIQSFATYFEPQTVEILLSEIERGKMPSMDLYALRNRLGSRTWDSPYIVYGCDVYKTKNSISDFFTKFSGRYFIASFQDYGDKMYFNLTSNQDSFYFKTFQVTIGSFKNEEGEKQTLSLYDKMPDKLLGCQ